MSSEISRISYNFDNFNCKLDGPHFHLSSGHVKESDRHKRKGSGYVELRCSALGACYKVTMMLKLMLQGDSDADEE